MVLDHLDERNDHARWRNHRRKEPVARLQRQLDSDNHQLSRPFRRFQFDFSVLNCSGRVLHFGDDVVQPDCIYSVQWLECYIPLLLNLLTKSSNKLIHPVIAIGALALFGSRKRTFIASMLKETPGSVFLRWQNIRSCKPGRWLCNRLTPD